MKTLLIGERLRNRSFNGANKSLPVLASALHNAGFHDTVQLDLERRDISFDDVIREAQNSQLIAFAGCMTPQWTEIDQHLQQLHFHVSKLPSAPPIIVGGYATKSAEDVARASPWIHLLFDGEGEEGIVELARACAQGDLAERRARIPGVCFLDLFGNYVSSVAPRVKTLDGIDQHFGFNHVPEIHDMDIFHDMNGRALKTAQLYTQRGCPWQCGYCNKSREGDTVTRLSLESFREQLRKLQSGGYEAVYLDVDTFTVNERASRQEAEILAEISMVWGTNTRIDKIDAEQIAFYFSRGCRYMFFGVEHILPEVLLAIGKFNGTISAQLRRARAYPEEVRQVFGQMHEAGLPSSYFIILGLPKAKIEGERITGYEPASFEDDLAAISFGLDHCDPDYLNLNVLRFMPGSAAADTPGPCAYSCVRPSSEQPVTAGHFLPRVSSSRGYRTPENHGVYRICESVGLNQPTSTSMDPERVHRTVSATLDLINLRIECGHKPTALFLDRDILEAGLVWRDADLRYFIAPLNEFAAL